MTGRGPVWAFAPAVLLATLPLLAAPPQLPLRPFATVYDPGQRLEVVVPRHLLAGADEFELLLQAPGLKVKVVRLTPSLLAANPVVTVEVPHLPAVQARLLLRVGAAGREWTAAASLPFFILPAPGKSLPTLVEKEGEWWLTASPTRENPFPSAVPGWQADLSALAPPFVSPKTDQSLLRLGSHPVRQKDSGPNRPHARANEHCALRFFARPQRE